MNQGIFIMGAAGIHFRCIYDSNFFNTLKRNINMTEQKKGEKKEFKVLDLEGVLFYPKVHKPEVNPYAKPDKVTGKLPSPQYSVSVIVDDKTAKLLKTEGLSVSLTKVKDEETDIVTMIPKQFPGFEGKKVFTFYRKTEKADGSPNGPLPVVDSQLNKVPSTTLIGNGSTGIVSINPWTSNNNGKVTHGANLLAIQVLDLVPYTAQEQKLSFKKREGFVAIDVVSNKFNDPVLTEANSSSDIGDEDVDY